MIKLKVDLCELLKGRVGEEFYFAPCGCNYKIDYVDSSTIKIVCRDNCSSFYLSTSGGLTFIGECSLFPSKKQRNWYEWYLEQNPLKEGDRVIFSNREMATILSIEEDGTVAKVKFMDGRVFNYTTRSFVKADYPAMMVKVDNKNSK